MAAASFQPARELVERYYCVLLDAGISRRAEHLLQEVRARLRHIEWMHSRLLTLEGKLVSDSEARESSDGQTRTLLVRTLLVFAETARPDCESFVHAMAPATDSDELRVLLEAYYYSAHRIRDILRDGAEDLPGLDGFEAIGIRNVRNHLVEHPTKKSGVTVFSFKCGGPVGPQLKALRWSLDDEGSTDEGLHKNTAEFLCNLERVITAYLSKGSPKKTTEPTR